MLKKPEGTRNTQDSPDLGPYCCGQGGEVTWTGGCRNHLWSAVGHCHQVVLRPLAVNV